jgi:hypothetical protein
VPIEVTLEFDQVTMHPTVAYYRCSECEDPMHESFVFISEDHEHDHHAVHHFTTLVNEQLLSRGLTIETQIQFSDGAPTQYKSKVNIVDMSLCQEELGFHVEKHFIIKRYHINVNTGWSRDQIPCSPKDSDSTTVLCLFLHFVTLLVYFMHLYVLLDIIHWQDW